MGRFDALNNLEQTQETITPPPVVPSPVPKTEQIQPIKTQVDEVKKPANPQTGKPESLQTRKQVNMYSTIPSVEAPEKYSTRLAPSLVKKIKVYAAEKELKDYEVVKVALLEYFKRNQ